ncbi:MAG TPA: GNAT family N-acetyltransferase [Oscillospiraceae bacterium]|jgi:RimJ/RimL family protein N-acetyltransferase|nr:GNAT family N-acetyltransferase [Oscillospiraceae bacterium]
MSIKEELFSERLILRPLRKDDFEAVHDWASLPDNVRFMDWGPNNEEDTLEFVLSAKAGYDFAVTLKSNGKVIGSCGIYPTKKETAEVGWILHRDYWKQGFGTELARTLVDYGFRNLKLHRITSTCDAENYGSYRVMENAGLRREAVELLARWNRVDEKWADQYKYAILAEEYEKLADSSEEGKK